MLKFYVLISIIAVVQMLIMYQYNISNQDVGFLGKISVAGFPYARPVCKIYPANIDDIHFSCD